MKTRTVLTTLSLVLGSALGAAGAQTVFEPLDGFPLGFGRDIELADFDDDGHLDLIEGHSDADTLSLSVTLSFGDGQGGFATPTTLPGAWPPVVVTDVDQDGLLDILHGAPAVPLLASVSVNQFPQEIQVGDLDGDGRIDLALMSMSVLTVRIQVLRGNGAGGFVETASLALFGAGHNLQVRLANAPTNSVAWLVVGGERVDAPFAGGVLVPLPVIVKGPYATGFTGQVSLLDSEVAPWPFDLFTQWWVVDDTAPGGLAASTAVRIFARD